MHAMTELAKSFDPAPIEALYGPLWEQRGLYKPTLDESKPSFCIQLPPPNVTGTLHMGHAFNQTIMDSLTRYHRMKGHNTLWIPGTDHAGIATQVVVEQKLAQEGLDRHKLGREKFLEHVWEWVRKSRSAITYQHQRLGASCDWTRERFTLDEGPSRAVRTAFVRLYNKGLIYRGERLINWCPRCLTALSDLEVQHKEVAGRLYYLRYPFADGSDLSAACLRVAYTVLLSAAAVLAVGHDLRHLPPMLSGVVLWLVFLGLVSSGSRPQPLRIQNGDLHVAPQRPPVQTTAWKRG